MKRLAVAGALALAAGLAGCGTAHSAAQPHVAAGCVLPGTHVTIPSMEGARFGGRPHSCVSGHWVPFSVKFNQS